MAQFLRVTILTAITIAAVSGAGCSRVPNTPSPVVADTTPPSVPGDVAANALSESAIDLSWSVSTDDTAVSSYNVYRSAEFLASSNTANLSDDALETSTEYCYTVTAVDESGNESQQSASPACATTFAPPPPPRMNIVVVFTDDQRWDSLPQMPILEEKLFSKGVTFRNAYVPTPICLPSRATMFSGGFLAQNTDVLENRVPNGGVGRFNDSESLGTVLQGEGYQTLFVGKYLNDYPTIAPYVPPGWTKFIGRVSPATTKDWFFFDYAVGSSSDSQSGDGEIVSADGQYTTDFERDKILSFLDNADTDEPFFVLFSTTVPHSMAMPAPGDEELFSDFTYDERAVGENDLSDKPGWVQNYNGFTTDEFFIRNQLRSLQSVDRAVGEIVDKVAALGKLDETVFIFTSDNGYLWGEHGLWGKGKPYEEALLVPFVIMMPGIAPRTDEHFVGANLDIGATVYDLANIQRQTDGMSLVPLLQDPTTPWRSELYFESFGNWIGGYGLWAILRDEQWKYTELGNGEHELYDLLNDPYELESQHDNPLHTERKSQMASRLGELKGLAMVPINFVTLGRVSRPFDKQLSAWGGSEPYTWTVYEGRLPEGLSLNAETGLITGLPLQAETRLLRFMVKSADRASHKGEVQSHISKPLKFVINP